MRLRATSATLLFVSMLPLMLPAGLRAFSGGPPNLRTWCGDMGSVPVCEGSTCGVCTAAGCHAEFAPPETSGVTVENLPAAYEPGTEYMLAVLLDPGVSFTVGGFELSALQAADLCQAGDLTAVATDTTVSVDAGTSTQWLKHTRPQDQVGGTTMWDFLWTAPAAGSGEVVVNVCGNAANDDGSPGGDRIFCTETIVPEATEPTVPTEVMLDRTSSSVRLEWSVSAEEFHVYRGALGSVGEIVTATGDYTQVDCAAASSPSEDTTPSFGDEAADFFYLVVPVSGGAEGSYGCTDLDADPSTCDDERMPSASPCG